MDVGRGRHVKRLVMNAPLLKRCERDITEECWIVSIMEKNKYTLNRIIMRSAMGGETIGNL
jgi:hypothetical protein